MELVFANFTSPKSRIALQVARKIAPRDRALNKVFKVITQLPYHLMKMIKNPRRIPEKKR